MTGYLRDTQNYRAGLLPFQRRHRNLPLQGRCRRPWSANSDHCRKIDKPDHSSVFLAVTVACFLLILFPSLLPSPLLGLHALFSVWIDRSRTSPSFFRVIC